MKHAIVLCVTTAVFAGCKGDVTETPPPKDQTSGENPAISSEQPPPRSIDSALSDQPGSRSDGYDSPQAAFAAFKNAAKDDDLPTAIKCMDDESQEMMATMMTLPLMFMAIDPEKEKDVKEFLSKHGISMEEESDEFPIKTEEERIDYITDLMEWLDKNADKTEQGPINKLADAELGELTAEEDRAHAEMTFADGLTDKIEFRRIDGNWFVHLPEPEFSSGPVTSSDGSEPFGGSDFGTFGGDDEPPPPIEAVPLEEFQAAWKIKLDVKDQPARELLTKLATQLGLELKVDPDLDERLQKPVSLEQFEGSQWGAIETIAQQADVTPVYTTSSISFEPGQREYPVVFAGPFLIEMTEFETDPATATGQISLNVFTAGLPPAVLGILNEGLGNPVELTAVTDSDGNDLRRSAGNGGITGFGGMQQSASSFQREILTGLKNLLRRVETVSQLEGVIRFSLPTEVEVFKFAELKPGAEKQAGDVSLKLKQINGGSVSLEYSGTDNDQIHLFAFDAQGKQLRSFSTSSFGGGGKGQMSADYQGTPARLEARVVTQQEDLEYEFKFQDIPVPNHSAMPAQLAELKFEGETPITLKFDSITGDENFRQIKLQVTNHSNKDVESISMSLSYLDGQGTELKKSPSSNGFDNIPAGESKDIEVSAFFMPEKTKSVKPTLKRVEFTDATEWNAKR